MSSVINCIGLLVKRSKIIMNVVFDSTEKFGHVTVYQKLSTHAEKVMSPEYVFYWLDSSFQEGIMHMVSKPVEIFKLVDLRTFVRFVATTPLEIFNP